MSGCSFHYIYQIPPFTRPSRERRVSAHVLSNSPGEAIDGKARFRQRETWEWEFIFFAVEGWVMHGQVIGFACRHWMGESWDGQNIGPSLLPFFYCLLCSLLLLPPYPFSFRHLFSLSDGFRRSLSYHIRSFVLTGCFAAVSAQLQIGDLG